MNDEQHVDGDDHHEDDGEEHHGGHPTHHRQAVANFSRHSLLYRFFRRISIRAVPFLREIISHFITKVHKRSFTFCLARLQFHPRRITLSRVKGRVRRARSMGTARAINRSWWALVVNS